jgi:hypothetical protein
MNIFMTNPSANINPATGIAYGIISSHNLDPEVVQQLMYGPQATDKTYTQWIDDRRNDLRCQIQNVLEDCGMEHTESLSQMIVDGINDDDFGDYQCEEPLIMGVLDGVSYGTCWLGGALNFFIFESSLVLDDVPECSPCVPNAGNLDSYLDGVRGNIQTYAFPVTWFEESYVQRREAE